MRLRTVFSPSIQDSGSARKQLNQFILKYLRKDRSLPSPVQSSRTTAVFRISLPNLPGEISLKIYSYKRVRQVMKGFFRNTFFGSSRAKQEWTNLIRLRSMGIPTPEPVAVLEMRQFRALRVCALATAWVKNAVTLDRLLLTASSTQVRRIALGLARLVARMHRCGYVDGDLHLRNLLVEVDASGEGDSAGKILKIDSPAGTMSRSIRGRVHDLACLEVGGRRFLRRSERYRFWKAYCAALGEPMPTGRAKNRLTAVVHRAEVLEAREGPRVDAVLKAVQKDGEGRTKEAVQ